MAVQHRLPMPEHPECSYDASDIEGSSIGIALVRRVAHTASLAPDPPLAAPRGWLIPGGGPVRRLRVAVTHLRLDRRLAEGADPAGSTALALRARQLTSRGFRERLASSIDDLLRDANRASIDAAHSELRHITEILRGPAPVYARGVALSRALVWDGRSPLYGPSEVGTAWYWAYLARQALEGRDW